MGVCVVRSCDRISGRRALVLCVRRTCEWCGGRGWRRRRTARGRTWSQPCCDWMVRLEGAIGRWIGRCDRGQV